MAVPTITSVSPVTGPAAGKNVITIVGTNFKVPVSPWAIPTPDAVPTVRVTLGGRTSPQVDVLSATTLRFVAPRMRHPDTRTDAYAKSTIVLTNLDGDGNPIAGESVTRANAYTYARWDLGAPREDPPLYKIARELIWSLKTEVCRYTHLTTHMEYGEEGVATVVNLANLPSINLTISTPRDIEFSAWDNYPEEVDVSADTAWVFRGARTHMLEATLYMAGEGSREAMFLTAAVEEFVQLNPLLTVEADQTLYPGEEDFYPLEISREPALVSSPNASSVVSYMMGLRVRGISVLPGEPAEISKKISDFVLAISDDDATAPVEMDI